MRSQIILFGDEMTESCFTTGGNVGWGAELARIYSRKADIIVRGYNGYTTNLAVCMLNRVFPIASTPPIATMVFFGGNDAAIPGMSLGHKSMYAARYRENLRRIVTHLQHWSPNMVVVLITPLPVNDEARKIFAGGRGLQDKSNRSTGLHARECVALAQELGLPCVDLYGMMQQRVNWEQQFLYTDGLHLTLEGHRFVCNAVSKVLKEEGLDPEEMEIDFPYEDDIDFKNPKPSFK